MSAYVVIVVNASLETIGSLNDKIQRPTKPEDAINALVDVLDGVNGGCYPASVQITTRNTDPGVTTSGTGSQQFTYNKK